MTAVVFKSLKLLNRTAKEAFSCEFDSRINVIHGENDTGKSSLIKSIYYTLGADLKIDKDWNLKDVISCVEFSYLGSDYSIIRNGSSICVFRMGEHAELIFGCNSISELSTFYNKILGYNLELARKTDGELSLGIPATLFLPFYIDQDKGWQDIFASFNGLQMYSDWLRSILLYHTGIKSQNYYALHAELRKDKIDIDNLGQQLAVIEQSHTSFEENLNCTLFDVDLDSYKEMIDDFMKDCIALEAEERIYRLNLLEEMNNKNSIVNQIDLCTRMLNDEISLPDHYENYYAYYLENEKITEVLPKLLAEQSEIDRKILKVKVKLNESIGLSEKIKEKLARVKEELSLNDVIKSQATKSVSEIFMEQIKKKKSEIVTFQRHAYEVEVKLKKANNAKLAKEINDYFKSQLVYIQNQLGFLSPEVGNVAQAKMIVGRKTGSRGPRAVFSVHYALLKTIKMYSKTPLLPIVIDSPKQQDLDTLKTELLTKVCVEDLSSLGQVFLGTVNLDQYSELVHKIRLNKPFHLLNPEQYEEVLNHVMPMYTAFLKLNSNIQPPPELSLI